MLRCCFLEPNVIQGLLGAHSSPELRSHGELASKDTCSLDFAAEYSLRTPGLSNIELY
jgi:hypothetical protein